MAHLLEVPPRTLSHRYNFVTKVDHSPLSRESGRLENGYYPCYFKCRNLTYLILLRNTGHLSPLSQWFYHFSHEVQALGAVAHQASITREARNRSTKPDLIQMPPSSFALPPARWPHKAWHMGLFLLPWPLQSGFHTSHIGKNRGSPFPALPPQCDS